MFASNSIRFASRQVAVTVAGRRTVATVAKQASSSSSSNKLYQPVLLAAGLTLAATTAFADREVRALYSLYCVCPPFFSLLVETLRS